MVSLRPNYFIFIRLFKINEIKSAKGTPTPLYLSTPIPGIIDESPVRVNGQYSKEFGVGIGVHQGSVLSPLLFILVLEALSGQFRTGVLAVMADSLEECVSRLKVWKEGMERKGLRVNMNKTKFMVSQLRLDLLRNSGAFPCAVCRSGAGVNSIQCSQCMYSVHKKCSGVRGRLAEDPDYVQDAVIRLDQLTIDLSHR